jgi:hypothetical protein
MSAAEGKPAMAGTQVLIVHISCSKDQAAAGTTAQRTATAGSTASAAETKGMLKTPATAEP